MPAGHPDLAEIIRAAANDEVRWNRGVLEIELDEAPLCINAEPKLSDEARATLLGRGATLHSSTVELTLPRSRLTQDELTALHKAKAVVRQKSIVVRADSVPAKLRLTLIAQGASVSGELIVPVLVGSKSDEYKPTSVWAAQAGVPKKLRLRQHQIDLAFAVTDHKVQGRTLDYLIMAIGPRRNLKPPLTLTSVHVLASRVRSAANLYVLGFDPATESDHLRQLKPSPELAIWEAGYTSGVWDGARAAHFAAQLAKDQAEAAKAAKQQARAEAAAQRAREKRAMDSTRAPTAAKRAKGGAQAAAKPAAAKRARGASDAAEGDGRRAGDARRK